MGMRCWMGSHFHDSIGYHGVTFLWVFLDGVAHFQDFGGQVLQLCRDLKWFVIQRSSTVRIPIFWLADLYHVILGYDEKPPWRHYRGVIAVVSCGVNSTHHCHCCHYTMASADSKYDDLSDADIDSLIEKATGWGISVLRGKVANFKFFIQASWGAFACCQQFCQLCAVYSIWIIKMLMHSLLVN